MASFVRCACAAARRLPRRSIEEIWGRLSYVRFGCKVWGSRNAWFKLQQQHGRRGGCSTLSNLMCTLEHVLCLLVLAEQNQACSSRALLASATAGVLHVAE